MKQHVSPMRWLRSSALAGTSVLLATAGHTLAGGHVDPILTLLLTGTAALAAYGWLRRERGLAAIICAVVAVQVTCHAVLSVGHTGAHNPAMLLTHAGAAILLAVFLRTGEARVYAAARRRYLQWVVAVRSALAGVRVPVARPAAVTATAVSLRDVWTPGVVAGRGPPARACV